jgi:hypothetical protein
MPDQSSGGSTPIPDPTVLTTEALHREIAAVRELVFERIARNAEVAIEKLGSVETQFELIERQRVEQKKDTKDAVDAALAAAKEAVKEQTTASERAIAKSEAATAEQLKQLSTTFTTAIYGTTTNHDDLKERVGKIESIRQGGKEAVAALYALAGFVVALVIIGGFLLASAH